jgi:hypothetical protein
MMALLCLCLVTGCVNREQADAKLANACEAAVNAFLPEGQRIDKVNDVTFSGSPVGPDFRHVTIHTAMIDGWLEAEFDYDCTFQEGFGFLNSGYTASIHNIVVDGRIIGKSGAEILGEAEDHIKLNEVVREALYAN